jgi:hypothetical protein
VFKGRLDEISYKRNSRTKDKLPKTVTVSAEAAMLLEGEAGDGLQSGAQK